MTRELHKGDRQCRELGGDFATERGAETHQRLREREVPASNLREKFK